MFWLNLATDTAEDTLSLKTLSVCRHKHDWIVSTSHQKHLTRHVLRINVNILVVRRIVLANIFSLLLSCNLF